MADHLPTYFSRRRNLDELLHSKDDESGYIEGKVFMIWPPRNRLHRINLEVLEGSALYRFEVEVPHKDGITFRPHQRVCFALKGMKVDRRKDSSAPHCFPIVLRFPDGVVLKYLNGLNAGKIVDTWGGNADEWYNPGVVHTVSNAVAIDASEVHGPLPTVACPAMPTLPRTGVITSGEDVIVGQSPPVTAQTTPPIQQGGVERSRRARRKKRRLLKEKEPVFTDQLANDSVKLLTAGVTSPCREQPQASLHAPLTNALDNHPLLHQHNMHANGGASVRGNNDTDIPRENNQNNIVAISEVVGIPAIRPSAGVRTQRGDIFTALSELRQSHSMTNVIGIVTHVTPERKTRTNEWCRSITLVDPSVIDSPRQNVKVNCFQKRYLEWLPQVRPGDIVILCKLKVVEYQGVVTATGYGDKLRWAVYDALKHAIRLPDKGTVPEKELIDDGMGYEYSPYWEPFQDGVELEYCREIGEWWKTLEGRGVVECPVAPCKQHLLISEASPDLPPRGFFNCTVEVLQKFNNHGDVTTVYVTDYTPSALVRSMQASWCPPQLSDCVLQCNMWDEARNIAKVMNTGEYWYLHNIRVRWNPDHHMEGTMQLAEKVCQLDETELESRPHLGALLARKKGFGLNGLGSAALHIFAEMLLQDVEEGTSFLTCIVELLHIDLNPRDGQFLYVTDYTYNPDLPNTVSTADWSHNLEHRVVKIKLDDAQAKFSSDLQPGSVYLIQNMRIKRSNVSGDIHGCLGGDEALVVSLQEPSSERTRVLQGNKEKWRRENMLSVPTLLSNGSHGGTHGMLEQPSTVLPNLTLQQALSCPAPAKFKVLARTVDYFPFSLEDACVLRCTKCGSSPLPSFQRCPCCDDMMETHCRWFHCLYILLKDDFGDELILSLSGKECMLLEGVDPTGLRCDRDAFHRFVAKLDPVLGNLRDVHAAWSRNEDKAVESPLMMFTVESWNVGSEKAYGLLDCNTT